MNSILARVMLGLCLLIGVYAYVLLFGITPNRADALAYGLIETCKDSEQKEICYERLVPELFPEHSIQRIFEIVREVRRLDPEYQFCHVLAHKLGENAVNIDPSKWLELIPLNPPDGICSNGFVHGVIVGRFRDDVLDIETLRKTIPDFKRACEPRENWSPSGLDQGICYHGMGHLFMFITNADIRTALDTCNEIGVSSTGDFTRVCREGVFMQTYQPLEPDDFELLELLPEKPTRENYRRLCAAYVNDAEEGACLREAWPFFREEILSGAGVAQFCSGQPTQSEEDLCFESATTIIGRQLLGNSAGMSVACNAVPNERQALCYGVTALALIEEDRSAGKKAAALCEQAREDVEKQCLESLATRSRWIFGDKPDERRNFCSALPQEYRQLCLQ